jgi:low affinity Fe/Cu permease
VAEFFRGIARRVTLAAGSWQFFLIALIGIGLWAITGPIFGFSDTWQLVINTSTTILTFVLGVLILLEANRQAKESKVVHDELLAHIKGARNSLINIDEMSDAELDKLEAELRGRAGRRRVRGEGQRGPG